MSLDNSSVCTTAAGSLVVSSRIEGARVKLSVVVPTYNEASNIVELIQALKTTLSSAVGDSYEIVVVDDNSPDGTWAIADEIAAEDDKVVVLRRTSERGLATAVIRGWQIAHGDVLAVIDGDLQHPPEVMAELWKKIAAGAEIAVASRHTDGGGLGNWNPLRRVVSRGAQLIGLALLPDVVGKVSDPMSGCFMVRRSTLQGARLRPCGYKILLEVLGRTRPTRVAEVGYVFRTRQNGSSKATACVYSEYLLHLWRLRSDADTDTDDAADEIEAQQLPFRNFEEAPANGFSRVLRSLPWMFVIALVLRLAVAGFTFSDHLDPDRNHWQFGWEMGRVAWSLYSGQGFSSPLFVPTGPTAEVMPVYPFLVAACMKLFGPYTAGSALAVLALGSLFAAITVIPVYLLAKRFFGERTAVVAGWMWVLSPHSICLSSTRIWENALTCMMASFLWLLTLRLAEKGKLREWLVWGALWGAVAMTSPALLTTLPLLGLWVVARRHKAGLRWLMPAAASALVFFAVILPWTVRNYQTFHRVMLRDNFWLEMHVGNSGDTSRIEPWEWVHPSENSYELAQFQQLGEIGYMDAKAVETKAFIHDNPDVFVATTLRRIFYFWTGYWGPSDPEFIHDLPNTVYTTLVTFLMLMGVWQALREGQGRAMIPVLLILVSFPIVYYISHPRLYFRHPIDPLVLSLASYGLVAFWRRRAEREALERMAQRDSAESFAPLTEA